MKAVYVSDNNHKKLKIKCSENDLQIIDLVDEIVNRVFESGEINEITENVVIMKESREAGKKGGE